MAERAQRLGGADREWREQLADDNLDARTPQRESERGTQRLGLAMWISGADDHERHVNATSRSAVPTTAA